MWLAIIRPIIGFTFLLLSYELTHKIDSKIVKSIENDQKLEYTTKQKGSSANGHSSIFVNIHFNIETKKSRC